MTNLGEGRFLISSTGQQQVVADISKIEKQFVQLGGMVEKINGVFVATWENIQTGAGSILPVLGKTDELLERIGRHVTEASKAFKGLETLQLSEGLQNIAGGPTPDFGIDKLIEQFKLLSTTDPFAAFKRAGLDMQSVLDQVRAGITLLRDEERKLVAQQKFFSEQLIVGPDQQRALEILEAQLVRTRERLEQLGAVVAETSKKEVITVGAAPPAGQLFDGSQFRDIDAMLEHTRTTAVSTQKELTDLGKTKLDPLQQSLELVAVGENKVAIAAKKVTDEINRLEAEFKQVSDAMRKGATDASLPTRMAQIEARAKTLGISLGKTKRQLDDLGKSGGRISGFFRSLGEAYQRLGEKIEDTTGIAASDFSILFGAGLAGGLAGGIRIVQKLTEAIIKFGTEQSFLAEQTRLSFGDASNEIQSFATTSVRALGVSETEALQTANAFAILAAETKLTGDQALVFAKALTAATAAIEATFPGFKTTEEAQQAVAAAIGGSEQALLRLGITLKDLNDIAERNFGGKLFQQLNELEQKWVRSVAVTEAATEGVAQFGAGAETMTDRIKDAQKVVGDFFGALNRGTVLDDPFAQVQASIESLVQEGKHGLIDQIFNFEGSSGQIGQLERAAKSLSLEQLNSAKKHAAANITDKKLREEVLKVLNDQVRALKEHQALLAGGTTELEKQADLHAQNLEEFQNNLDLQRQAADAVRAIKEAELDGNRRVEQSEIALQRVREDNARKYRDLIIRNQRTAEDAAHRVEEAEFALQDARDNAADRIEDANDRVEDAQKQAFRSTRAIKERIGDLERDHARKVEEAQKKVADAHRDTAKAVFEAQLDIEAALRGMDDAAFNAAQRAKSNARESGLSKIAETEADLARDQEDHERELGRLRRDLKEARLDGIEEIARAERDRLRAERDGAKEIAKAERDVTRARVEQVRALEDAIRALSDLEVEQNRALADAKRGLEEAEIARDRAIQSALRGYEKLREQIGLVTGELLHQLEILMNHPASRDRFFPPGLAHGGSAYEGHPYIVGEEGPELFVPNKSGDVVSAADLMALFKQLRTGGSVGGSPNITVYESYDARATAWAVSARLAQFVRN